MKTPRNSHRKRKLVPVILAIVSVIALAAIGYVIKDRFIGGETAGAADSTAVDSTAVAGKQGEEKGNKGNKGNKGKKGKKGKKGNGDEKEKPDPVPVEVAAVGHRELSSYYVTTATLEPEKKVDILAKIGGEVIKMLTEEGAQVKAGELLCRLDEKEQRVLLEEARINRDQRQREMKRLKGMHDQDLISDKEYDDVLYQFELAENGYQSALLQHQWTQIRAPFDGVITERSVDEGEHINIGARLFVLADTEPLQLTMYLPEGEIKSIRVGQIVHIRPDINPDQQFYGEIIRIAPEVDLRTGTIKVTAVTKGGGLPGSFVRVQIVTDTHSGSLAVPRRSILADAGDRFVFVAEADSVRKVEVETGFEDESFTEILSGVSAGDSVVTAGVGAIRGGTKVKVLGRDAAAVAKEDTVEEAANN